VRAILPLLLVLGQEDAVSPREAAIKLFNGKDLEGFTTWLHDSKREDPRHVFSVRDGLLRISGDGFGYLATARAYRDYRLVVEFKWGARNWRGREKHARDSGIFLHSAGPDGNSFDGQGAFKAAIECQVMQGRVGDLMVIGGKDERGDTLPIRMSVEAAPRRDGQGWVTWKKGGEKVVLERRGRVNWFGIDPDWKDVLDFRGANDVESPRDEWTRVECVCDGDRIAVTVNGVLVNEAFDVFPTRGPILLQAEGSEIFFRTFELHPLKRP
jgi:hypothetical protein